MCGAEPNAFTTLGSLAAPRQGAPRAPLHHPHPSPPPGAGVDPCLPRAQAIALLKERSEALRTTSAALEAATERRDEAVAGWQAAEQLVAKEAARRRELGQMVAAVRLAVGVRADDEAAAAAVADDTGESGAGVSSCLRPRPCPRWHTL